MSAKNFTMDMREDGRARLSLSYKGTRQHGISRISCEISSADVIQTVLFEGSVSVQTAVGATHPIMLELEGLVLRFGSGDTDRITFERLLGFSSQMAFCPLKEFHVGMAEVADICLARAEASKHGKFLKDTLDQCTLPETLLANMDPDAAEEVFHRLREMTLLILVEEVTARGSVLARKLRTKKSREEAAKDIGAVLNSLVDEFVPAAKGLREGGTGGPPAY